MSIFKYPLLGNIVGNILVIVYKGQKVNVKIQSTYLVKVFVVNKLIPSSAVAITYGTKILIKSKTYNDITQRWLVLSHETVHIDQWCRYGFFGVGFLVKYIFQYCKYG
jgi:hypothetical protein